MFFDKLREGAQGTTSKIILGAIILSFALAGVGSYVTQPAKQVAAVVNDEEISAQALENAYRNERDRLQSQLGEQFSQLLADPTYVAQIRRSVLEQMIEQSLIDQKIAELGLRASDEQVRQAIRALPEFQTDGKFDNDRYLQLLGRNNLTPEQLRDSIRQDLNRQMLLNAIVGSAFSLQNEAGLLDRLTHQQRSATLVRLPLAEFESGAEVTDDEAKAWYEAHPEQFQRPEQVKLNYVLLDANTVSAQDIDELAIEDFYAANQASYTQPEQRRVAHIMVNKDGDAEQKIQAILERLNAGEEFAELAASESDDAFTGEKGGELDWMEAGTLDPAFDKAAFALANVGDVSEVVESDFGLHLIKLLEVREAQVKPLSDVRDSIAERLAADQAGDDFYQREQRLAELAFEFPDSLDMAADDLELTVQSTDFVSAGEFPQELSDTRVISKAFSPELREQAMNSDIIELGDNQAAVIRVLDYRPAAVRDFDEVKTQALELARKDKAAEQAQQAADALEQAWRDGNAEAWLSERELDKTELADVTRESAQDPALLNALFAMPVPSEQPSLQTVTLMGGDIAVLKLNAVNTPAEPSEQAALVRQGQGRVQGQRDFQSLISALKATADIEYRQVDSEEDSFF
ncbi:SurA N-terminal domain-containing protein [Oceanimonas baumannii]|uniref:Periplasmic chaperone PpiD n=1 Tax=Oceanimonas baumannii TaxID=129578 RepID=A0A235CM35_9GAMM|nr:SurA N-terminal domain-containing protein [Oceanimonas baumannii]OYD24895.1 peptidylprolyl isomerase [Oceanimonas baumannii]TDW59655.1 peptidyl-prolyl cis-trans isomerase D [Oceanimonas baumannii]